MLRSTPSAIGNRHGCRQAPGSRLLALKTPLFSEAHPGQCRPLAVVAAAIASHPAEDEPTSRVRTSEGCSTSRVAAISTHLSSHHHRAAFSTRQAVASDVTALLGACRTVFCCTALCAIWASLSSCTSAGTLLASMTLSLGGPLTGAHLPARSAWTGLAAGALHTLCGPDHLAALTPLTIGRDRMVASAMGALWGFGHATGQACLGLAFVLLKERFHNFAPALTRWSGTIVGLTLLAIGAMGIWESHFMEEEQPDAALAGAGEASSKSPLSHTKTGLATYATGILYGLQPDALFVIVPALALPTQLAATMYCLGFVLGTVGAMGGYTLVIGSTTQALLHKRPWLQSHLSTVASIIAIGVGIIVLLGGVGIEIPFL